MCDIAHPSERKVRIRSRYGNVLHLLDAARLLRVSQNHVNATSRLFDNMLGRRGRISRICNEGGNVNSPLEHSHAPKDVARRLEKTPQHSYLADFVYGAIDGTVTTFAVVSGVAGAGLASEIIVVLGLANLAGDGFSMAASNYLGTRTDAQLLDKAREMERRHIATDPAGEREEVRQIYARKGFSGELLEEIVAGITSNEQRWINTMLTEELGLRLNMPSAIRAAVVTFVAFIVVGFIPLFSFVWQLVTQYSVEHAYAISTCLTAVAFFGVGAAKSLFVEQKWYKSGLETLLIGGTAAALAYGIGAALQSAVPG